MRKGRKNTVRPCLKRVACQPSKILSRSCLVANCSERNRRVEFQAPKQDKVCRSCHMTVTLFLLASPASGIEMEAGMNQKATDVGQIRMMAILPQSSFLMRKNSRKTSAAPALNNPQYDYLILTRLRDNRIRKDGPNFLMFTSGGNSASVAVPKTFAKIKSSPSGTRRCWVSSFASDSRLTSHPKTCNFAENSSCVQPLRSRNSRTCGPIRFSGNETFLMPATVAVSCRNIVRLRSQIRLVNWQALSQSSARNPEGGHMKIIGIDFQWTPAWPTALASVPHLTCLPPSVAFRFSSRILVAKRIENQITQL